MANLGNSTVYGSLNIEQDLKVSGQIIGNLPGGGGAACGTCATAANTAAKVVTISGSWELKVGNVIAVKFTNNNEASNCTINVNNTGAKQIWYSSGVYTSNSMYIAGASNKYVYYVYDGTYWVWLNFGELFISENTIPSAYSNTAADTSAKTADYTNFSPSPNSYIYVTLCNSNTTASALTLNINNTGTKPIYINGVISSSTNYSLPAGSYVIYYDGTNYYFRTDGLLPGSLSAGAALIQSSDNSVKNVIKMTANELANLQDNLPNDTIVLVTDGSDQLTAQPTGLYCAMPTNL